MKNIIRIFFFLWLATIFIFSDLLLLSLFSKKEPTSFYSDLVIYLIIAGSFFFLLLWGVGILASIKSIYRQFVASYLWRSLVISGCWIAGTMVILLGIKGFFPERSQQFATGPLSTVQPALKATPSILPTPNASSKVTTKPMPSDPYASNTHLKDADWGKAVQVEEGRYTMKVGMDSVMGTPQEIFQAVNVYRNTKGRSSLNWDEKLSSLARERVLELPTESKPHEGFSRRMAKDGFWDEYGIVGAGENSSQGVRMTGTHLIEWIYASDEGHDRNQLNPEWSHVGIATSGSNSVLIFAKK